MTAAHPFDPLATGTEIQRRIGVKTSRDEPLARFTTMRVGGPADLFAVAHNAFELRALVRFARARAIPLFLLGRGSDLVISDAGIRGLVVQVRAEATRVDGERFTAEAGTPMARAATETQKAGLTGLEFGLAIPGTVGGAVWANAGAHDGDVADPALGHRAHHLVEVGVGFTGVHGAGHDRLDAGVQRPFVGGLDVAHDVTLGDDPVDGLAVGADHERADVLLREEVEQVAHRRARLDRDHTGDVLGLDDVPDAHLSILLLRSGCVGFEARARERAAEDSGQAERMAR